MTRMMKIFVGKFVRTENVVKFPKTLRCFLKVRSAKHLKGKRVSLCRELLLLRLLLLLAFNIRILRVNVGQPIPIGFSSFT